MKVASTLKDQISKKKNNKLYVQHPFPLISKKQIARAARFFVFPLPLFCTSTTLFCTTKAQWDGRNCWPATPNIVGCYMLRPFAHPVACCCAKFETSQTFQPTTPKFLLFCDHRSVAQQCWIRLHSSSNIVGATHAHYAWFTKTYGLYPSHDARQVPTLMGVVTSVCKPLPTRTRQLPTLVTHHFYGRIFVWANPIFCFLCSCSLLFFTAAHFRLAGR